MLLVNNCTKLHPGMKRCTMPVLISVRETMIWLSSLLRKVNAWETAFQKSASFIQHWEPACEVRLISIRSDSPTSLERSTAYQTQSLAFSKYSSESLVWKSRFEDILIKGTYFESMGADFEKYFQKSLMLISIFKLVIPWIKISPNTQITVIY